MAQCQVIGGEGEVEEAGPGIYPEVPVWLLKYFKFKSNGLIFVF